jgi:hypothetical protein
MKAHILRLSDANSDMLKSPFLRALAELPTETISFVMSVCLSVRPSVSPHGTTQLPPNRFSLNFLFADFSTSVEKIQVALKSDKNNGYFT